jgi:hypothetical protein
VACDSLPDFDLNNSLNNLKDNEFYAQNMTNGRFYKVSAEILYEGSKCVIWAEKGSGVTQKQAQDIAHEYDTVIRPRVVGAFSLKNVSTKDDKYTFADMLEYANWIAGRDDQKLTILLLDIKDGFKNKDTDSYVAGYFYGADLQPRGNIAGTKVYSNGRDMIYIDTYPGLELMPKQTYATFAHELQHLINYVTSWGTDLRNGSMDTWIDEGLSSQAEYLYLEKNPEEKIEWFSKDQAGTIAKGNNFFVWDNHKENKLAIMDDYASVYLFFRWLYLQAESKSQPNILYKIANSDSTNHQAVTDVAKQINPEWGSWEPLLRTWLAANYYPANPYGYTGDEDLKKAIKVELLTGNTVSLFPGEGVYSTISNSFAVSGGTNIRYAGLSTGTANIGTSSPYNGNVLLTFNANPDNKSALRETGSLTGVSPSILSRTAGEGDQTKKISGPYVIDARDLLGRDSW